MTSSSSARRAFYPLPPSVYPQPLVDPCPALETTYGHNHCAHTVRDDNFFRSRTLNPASSGRQLQSSAAPGLAHANQGIYPRHGTGQFIIPYYRRDSKGFRRPFEQPAEIDQHYSVTKNVTGLIQGGFQFAHPSSRPTYSASRAGSAQGAGATFSTSYRNSGLYDTSSNHTSRVARTVADGLQLNRSQQLSQSSAFGRSQSARPSTNQAAPGEFGYYTREVADAPPSGVEAYETYESNLADASSEQPIQRSMFGDPLLKDPLENAYRKPRTVYKRSFGKCQ